MNYREKLLDALDTMIDIIDNRQHLLSPWEQRVYREAKEAYEQAKGAVE